MSVNKSVSVQVLLLIVLTTSNFPPLQFAYNYGQTIIASSFHNKSLHSKSTGTMPCNAYGGLR